MFHKIEIIYGEDTNRDYVKRIVFDIGDAMEELCRHVEGYEDKSIEQLEEEGEIKVYCQDDPVPRATVMEFARPLSLDRFLAMFRDYAIKERESLEAQIAADSGAGLYEGVDPKKYVV